MRKFFCFQFFFTFSFLIFSASPFSVKSLEEDYFDFLSLQGYAERPYLNYRTLSDNKWTCTNEDENIWKNNNLGNEILLWKPENISSSFYSKGINQAWTLNLFGPLWFNSYNTTTPFGQNDGALWQGRGYNTSFTAGVRLEGYGLELTIKPQFSFSQNKPFEIMKSAYENEFGYFWKTSIDKPQRFGNDAFCFFDWGDSEIRWTLYNWTIGFGTEAIWLGPAYLNPLLHSNNAPSYPKLDLGLKKQKIIIPGKNWEAGDIEARIWVGQLSESQYFDSNPLNNKRLISGYNLSFSPSFIPGFTIGINKICLALWEPESIKYLNPFYKENTIGKGPNTGEDIKVSLMVDWLFPSVGFEIYGEGAVDDHTSNPISNPFHTLTYTLGVKQIFDFIPANNIKIQFTGEITNLEMTQDFQLQWAYGGLYSHSGIIQGYTQKGQILGAGSSIAGNSQYAELKIYHPKFTVKIFFHRYVPDMNYVLSKAVNNDASYNATINGENSLWKDWYANYETYIGGGAEINWFITPDIIFIAGLTGMYINSPKYQQYTQSGNFSFRLGGEYKFPL